MEFKVGDKVLFKKEKQSGVIIKINSLYKVQIETPDGFEINVSIKDIILIDSLTEKSSAYGTDFYHKDLPNSKKSSAKQQRSQTILKVDLHIELLTSNCQYMDNFEIVQIQMEYCRKELNIAIQKHKDSLEIIHGIGEGVLKEEVHKLLRLYNLTFFESNNSGSTEVVL